jgi:hypothetical protein
MNVASPFDHVGDDDIDLRTDLGHWQFGGGRRPECV